MTPELMQTATLIVFVVAVGFLLWQQYKSGKPITIDDVITAVVQAKPITEKVNTVAEAVVMGYEQIKRNGGIDNDEAFRKAFDEIRAQFPLASGVTDEQIILAINGAVLKASNLTALISVSKGQ